MSTVISTLFVKIKVSVFETTKRAAIKPVGIYNGTYCFFNQNEADYFESRGVTVQHGGGNLFAEDEEIMGWLFAR
jgi:hypothetical protein